MNGSTPPAIKVKDSDQQDRCNRNPGDEQCKTYRKKRTQLLQLQPIEHTHLTVPDHHIDRNRAKKIEEYHRNWSYCKILILKVLKMI